ncbi:MAG: hypothetical protein ACTHQQ_11290 [Solirubrobacteraceae bacterium]
MPGPIVGVDGVVLDGGLKPQPMASSPWSNVASSGAGEQRRRGCGRPARLRQPERILNLHRINPHQRGGGRTRPPASTCPWELSKIVEWFDPLTT